MTAWDLERSRYADKMRALGTPLKVTRDEFDAAAKLLARAHSYGMSDRMIAEQVGVHESLPSKVRNARVRTMHRKSFERVMSLRPQRPSSTVSLSRGKVGAGAYTDPTGTVRRMQALRADGFPGHLLGGRIGVSYEAVAQLAHSSRGSVLETTRISVASLYRELDGRWPGDFGVRSNVAAKCATFARRAGYAPRSCWDPDTIDDPEAFPEWTGRCGTPFGHLVHERDGIPLCARCEDARVPLKFSGDRLRAARVRAGFTQRNLEKVLDVGQGHVHHWESGRYGPRKEKLHRVLSALDITFEDVYEEERRDGR